MECFICIAELLDVFDLMFSLLSIQNLWINRSEKEVIHMKMRRKI